MRDRGLPNRKTTTKATTADFGLRRDVLENFEPAWVGQRLRYPLELLDIHEGQTPATVRYIDNRLIVRRKGR